MKKELDGTVTISIQRFKDLEAIEAGMSKLQFPGYYDPYDNYQICSTEEITKQLRRLVEERLIEYEERIKELISENKKLTKEVNNLKSKRWRLFK